MLHLRIYKVCQATFHFKNLFQQIVSFLKISFKYYVLGEMHQLLDLMEYLTTSTKNALN